MSAQDNLNDIQFSKRKRKSTNGVTATTISARHANRTLGYAKVTDGGSFLDSLYVRPEARGRGLGHQLVNQVTQNFGDRTIRLHASPFQQKNEGPGSVIPGRDSLMEFYGQHGFETEGEPEGDRGYMVRRPRNSGT